MSQQEKWNRRYRQRTAGRPPACLVLQEYLHLLPQSGRALDLAAGRGGNALLLAERGLLAEAWDISDVALGQLQQQAARLGLALTTSQRDIISLPPAPASFDVIVVSRFLHRPLCPQIAAALRPGGLLFYQTFTRERLESAATPANPDYLLQHNELLQLFAGLSLIAYREEGNIGDTAQGLRNEAWLVARQNDSPAL